MTATATPPAPADAARHDWKPELHEIPLKAIDVGDNVRAVVGDVDELAASIRSVGVLEPIRVVETGAGRYQLLFGQRRLAAARSIDLGTIPAIVVGGAGGPVDQVVAQLIENLHREDLNPLDAATAYRAILDQGITQRELANLVGVAQSTIAHALRLLKVPEAVRAQIADGSLSASHAKAIAGLPDAEQAEVARRVVEHGLSAHDVEEEVRLAEQRRRAADQKRDQEKNRAATLFEEWTALLAKKKANPETTTLVGWSGMPAEGLTMLAAAGWTRSQTASCGVDATWHAPAPKGCSCDAFELSYSITWTGGTDTYKATLRPACIVKAHVTAAQKAERKAWEAEQAEQRAAEQKASDERAAALAPLAVAATTPIPPTKAKLLLFAILSGGTDNGYWGANRWILAHNAGEGLPYGHWRDHLWVAIDKLSHDKLLIEIAQLVAAAAVDAGGKVRAAIDELAGTAPAKPKRGKAAKGGAS